MVTLELRMICAVVCVLSVVSSVANGTGMSPGKGKEIEYEKSLMALIPWGTGPDQVGLYEEEREERGVRTVRYTFRQVPRAIRADGKGNVYLWDRVNHRILRIDGVSHEVAVIECNDGSCGVVPDRALERLYVRNKKNKTVDIIYGKGRRERLHVDEEAIAGLDDLRKRVVVRNGVVRTLGQGNVHGRFRALSMTDTGGPVEVMPPAIADSIVRIDGNTMRFAGLSDIGGQCPEVVFRCRWPWVKGIGGFLGVDGRNRFYHVETVWVNDSESRPIVIVVDPKQCEAFWVELEPDVYEYWTSLSDRLYVDDSGNIYQLNPSPAGARIFKWRRKDR